MRHVIALTSALALTGCGSVLDPAPYSPQVDKTVLDAAGTNVTAVTLQHFANLTDAETKLQALALGYAGERDTLLRQQLILFDGPALGLGVSGVASAAFHGALASTKALVFGAAGFAGGRTYFQPSIKVNAYNSAASALSCAAGSAASLNSVTKLDGQSIKATAAALQSTLAAAASALANPGDASPTERAALNAAQIDGQKALADLLAADQLLDAASTKLSVFAMATIRKATSTVVSGAPSVDTVIAGIKTAYQAGIPGAAPAKSTTTPAPVNAAVASDGTDNSKKKPTAQDTTTKLAAQSASATKFTQDVNNAWAEFAACTTLN